MIKTFSTKLSFLLLGEQVDLSSFAPACLPTLDQSFADSDGRVAGEKSFRKSFYLTSWFSQVGAIQKKMTSLLIILKKLRLDFPHLINAEYCSTSLCKSVLITLNMIIRPSWPFDHPDHPTTLTTLTSLTTVTSLTSWPLWPLWLLKGISQR